MKTLVDQLPFPNDYGLKKTYNSVLEVTPVQFSIFQIVIYIKDTDHPHI